MLAQTLSRLRSSPRGTGGNRFRAGACRVGLLALGCSLALALAAGDAFAGQLPVSLRAASSYAALAGSTVTSTGLTTLHGDLGVWPGTSLTGFPPGMVSGTVHAGDPFAMSAQGDLTAAYNDAAGRQPPQALPADVGGETLAPGVYKTGGLSGEVCVVVVIDQRLAALAVETGAPEGRASWPPARAAEKETHHHEFHALQAAPRSGRRTCRAA